MDQEKSLVRYCAPSNLNEAEFGTRWKVQSDDGNSELYIQLSEDPTNPKWEKVSYLMEKAFQEFFSNDAFIEECLRLYKYNERSPLKVISQIIQEGR